MVVQLQVRFYKVKQRSTIHEVKLDKTILCYCNINNICSYTKVGGYVKIFQPRIISPIINDGRYILACADFLMGGEI